MTNAEIQQRLCEEELGRRLRAGAHISAAGHIWDLPRRADRASWTRTLWEIMNTPETTERFVAPGEPTQQGKESQ